MTLVRPGPCSAEAYLEEDAVRRVKAGDSARFVSDSGEGASIALSVKQVEQDATRALPSGILAAAAGGSVVTREKDHLLVPERAVYRVLLACEATPESMAGHSWRGRVVISGAWEAPGWAFARTALAIVWREAGF